MDIMINQGLLLRRVGEVRLLDPILVNATDLNTYTNLGIPKMGGKKVTMLA